MVAMGLCADRSAQTLLGWQGVAGRGPPQALAQRSHLREAPGMGPASWGQPSGGGTSVDTVKKPLLL